MARPVSGLAGYGVALAARTPDNQASTDLFTW